MIRLGNASIYYAVMKCVETVDYKIIIAVSNRLQIQQVFNRCMEVIERFNYDKPEAKISQNYFLISFKNGSSIRCIPANDNAIGHAAHLVIDDRMIDDNIKNNTLRCIEKIRE